MANLPAKDATGAKVYIKADGTGTDDSNAYRVTNRLENTSGTQINPATEDTLASIETDIATLAGAVTGTEVQVDVLTLPSITGTVTANAGTNLNTSALALESGGNLALIAGRLPSALGTQLAANSLSIAPASDSTFPISGTITANLGTIAGVATQTTLAALLTELQGKADLTETQPVSLASAPLPSGAATSANQTTLIGHVDGIEGLLTTIDSDTSDLAGTVSAGRIQVSDGGGSLTVDGTVGVAGTITVDGSAVTQPVSAASLPLPTGAATAANQTTTNDSIGATSATAATSDTGTFSLISLFKRLLARIGATRLYVGTTVAVSGDNTVIVAPGAGVRIVITGLRVQNETSTATTVLIKDGASTTLAKLRTPTDGSGLSENYYLGDEIRLSEDTAFVVNLSGANNHGVSVRYWLETVSTGLPA